MFIRIGETVRMFLGVTLLPREVLETKAVGGASTVKVERRNEQYLDGAQRAVKYKGD